MSNHTNISISKEPYDMKLEFMKNEKTSTLLLILYIYIYIYIYILKA